MFSKENWGAVNWKSKGMTRRQNSTKASSLCFIPQPFSSRVPLIIPQEYHLHLFPLHRWASSSIVQILVSGTAIAHTSPQLNSFSYFFVVVVPTIHPWSRWWRDFFLKCTHCNANLNFEVDFYLCTSTPSALPHPLRVTSLLNILPGSFLSG